MIMTGEKEERGEVERWRGGEVERTRVPVRFGAPQMSREAVRGPVILPRHN